MLVSIAIITYNQQLYLRDCIDSCLMQSYKNIEIIISDDGSIDNTKNLIQEYLNKYPDKIRASLSKKNRGITKNCNTAWAMCNGKWIKTIAGDDILALNCIELYVSFSKKNKFDIAFSNLESFSRSGNDMIIKPNLEFFKASKRNKIKILSLSNGLTAPTSFIKKSSLDYVGMANERYPMIEDYPLWLKMVECNLKFDYLEVVTVFYRRDESVSSNVSKICNYGFVSSLYNFQKEVLWKYLPWYMILKIHSDSVNYYKQVIGFYLFRNKRDIRYKILLLLTILIDPYGMYKKIVDLLKININLKK